MWPKEAEHQNLVCYTMESGSMACNIQEGNKYGMTYIFIVYLSIYLFVDNITLHIQDPHIHAE